MNLGALKTSRKVAPILSAPKSRKSQSLAISALTEPNPNLLFLAFFGFPCFFPFQGIPCFFVRFPFFSKDFRGSAAIKNPCFFGGFPCRFSKKKKARKRRSGNRQTSRRKKGGLGSEIAARDRKSLATSHRTLKSQGRKWLRQFYGRLEKIAFFLQENLHAHKIPLF